MTALWFAAEAGQVEAARWLLARGATTTLPSLVGVAAAGGHLATMRLLVEAGADPHAAWHDGASNARTMALAEGKTEADALLAAWGVALPLPPAPRVLPWRERDGAALVAAARRGQALLGLVGAGPEELAEALDHRLANTAASAAEAKALGPAFGEAVIPLGVGPSARPSGGSTRLFASRFAPPLQSLRTVRYPGLATGLADHRVPSFARYAMEIVAAGWSWCRLSRGGPVFAVTDDRRRRALLPLALVRAPRQATLTQLLAAVTSERLPGSTPGALLLVS